MGCVLWVVGDLVGCGSGNFCSGLMFKIVIMVNLLIEVISGCVEYFWGLIFGFCNFINYVDRYLLEIGGFKF